MFSAQIRLFVGYIERGKIHSSLINRLMKIILLDSIIEILVLQ